MSDQYYRVEIREDATGNVEAVISERASERMAERMKRGADINLNHAEYTTHLVEVD